MALAILVSSVSAWAQGAGFNGEVIRPTATIAGASIRVCTDVATGTPCSPLATIYSDSALSVTIAGSIVTADSAGNYKYYAAVGCYQEQISASGFATKTQPVCGSNPKGAINFSGGVTISTLPYTTTSAGTHSGTETYTGPALAFTGPKSSTTFAAPAMVNSVIVDSSPNSSDTRAQASPYVLPYYRSDILATGSGVPGNFYSFLKSTSTTANPAQDTSNLVAGLETVTLMGQSSHSGAWGLNPVLVLDQIYTWAGTTSYAFGLPVIPTAGNGHFYRQTGGAFGDFGCTSSGSQPSFPTGAGASVGDGTCTWTESGAYPLTICGGATLGNSCDAEMFGVEVNTFNNRADPAPGGLGTRTALGSRLKAAFAATDNGLFPIHVDYLSTYTAAANKPYIGYWVQDAKSSGVQIGDPNCIGCPLTMVDGVRLSEKSVATAGNNYGSVNHSWYDSTWNGAAPVEHKWSSYSSPLAGTNPQVQLKFDYNAVNQATLNSTGSWLMQGSDTITSAPPTQAASNVGWKFCTFSNTTCQGIASATEVHQIGTGSWLSVFSGATYPANAASSTTPDANSLISLGTNGEIVLKEISPPSAPGATWDGLFGDSGTHTPSWNNNNNGTSSPTGAWQCTNVTPVTVNANVTTDQNLMACTIPAGTLNRVGRTLRVKVAGIYTTAAASTAQMTLKVKLCTVSGCGSGTVISPISIQTSALATQTIAAENFSLRSELTTQTAGASSAYEAHGEFLIDLSATIPSGDTVFGDPNTATVGTIDSTAQLFLQCAFAFSAASATNSATQRQLVLETVN